MSSGTGWSWGTGTGCTETTNNRDTCLESLQVMLWWEGSRGSLLCHKRPPVSAFCVCRTSHGGGGGGESTRHGGGGFSRSSHAHLPSRCPPFLSPYHFLSPEPDIIFPGKCSRGYFWYPTGSHQRPDLSSNHPVKKPPLCFLWRSSQSSPA